MQSNFESENQKQHDEIKAQIVALNTKVENAINVVPMIIKYICLPLILILGGAFGVEKIIAKVIGG